MLSIFHSLATELHMKVLTSEEKRQILLSIDPLGRYKATNFAWNEKGFLLIENSNLNQHIELEHQQPEATYCRGVIKIFNLQNTTILEQCKTLELSKEMSA